MADMDTELKRRFAAGEEPAPGLTDEQKRRWAAGIYPFGTGEIEEEGVMYLSRRATRVIIYGS